MANDLSKRPCSWPGCDKLVDRRMWGCTSHWFKLPTAIRKRIWETFRPGQELDGNPSVEYLDAFRNAHTWIVSSLKPMSDHANPPELQRLARLGREMRRVQKLVFNGDRSSSTIAIARDLERRFDRALDELDGCNQLSLFDKAHATESPSLWPTERLDPHE